MTEKKVSKNKLPKENFDKQLKMSRGASFWHNIMKFFQMRVLNWYLFKTVLVSFIMALVIVTFLMLMGSLVQIVELIFKKFDVITIVKFILICIPSVLCYALPFSMAGASLLVYSRLSADGEITAMKATGISVYRVAAPAIALSILVAMVSAYTYNNILPKASSTRKEIITNYAIEDPSALIETGTMINIGRYRLFIEEREGNLLRNILLVQDLDNGKSRRINSRSGVVKYIALENKVHFEMNDVVSEERSEDHTNSYLRTKAGRVDLYVDLDEKKEKKKNSIFKRRSIDEYTTAELFKKLDDNYFEVVRKACRQLPEFLALPQSNRVEFVENLSENQQKKIVDDMFVKLGETQAKWAKLQKQKAWKSTLKKLDTKSGDAWVDLVNVPKKVYKENEYFVELMKIDGKDGPTLSLFQEWIEAWPQGFHNALDQRSRCKTIINYRLSYAFASIAFVIIGVPLGIRAQRSEKTIGFLICLALIAIHYTLVIVVTQFKEYYGIHPEILIWCPDILFVLTGFYLMWRNHHNS